MEWYSCKNIYLFCLCKCKTENGSMAGFHWKLIITNFLYLLLLLSLFQIKRIPALEFSINNFSSVSSFFCALKLWLHNHFFLSLFTFHKTCSKSMEREETASRKERKKNILKKHSNAILFLMEQFINSSTKKKKFIEEECSFHFFLLLNCSHLSELFICYICRNTFR